jgi:hypothetical protein
LRDQAPLAPQTRRCRTPDRVRGDDGRERVAFTGFRIERGMKKPNAPQENGPPFGGPLAHSG